jgi:molybdopterin converting factor small subunit
VTGQGAHLPEPGAPGAPVVSVRLFAAASAAAGARTVEVPAGGVAAVVSALVTACPPRFGEVLAVSSLMCDGQRLDPTSTEALAGGAVLDVLPPFAGG